MIGMHGLFCKELLWTTVSSERGYNTLLSLTLYLYFAVFCFILNIDCLVFLEPFS